ncbi:hypothetical protein LJC46_06110 [Desulfovibrio sp. OttesenSCG-928-G15]|nr:hypothetical protein [Desulfovibrio sp. OttesenSCG-928-G15]
MHPSLALLKEVTALLREEEVALADENLEAAEELSAKRKDVLADIWAKRQGCDEEELRKGLSAVLAANRSLQIKAESLQQKYQAQKQAGRKQTKYFSTERHLHSAMRKSVYCDSKT